MDLQVFREFLTIYVSRDSENDANKACDDVIPISIFYNTKTDKWLFNGSKQ